MIKRNSVILALTLLCAASASSALPIVTWGTTDAHVYGTTVNFDSVGLANNTAISNQFQSAGLTFSGAIRANSCGTGSWSGDGMAFNTLNTFGPGCTTNNVNDAFALKINSAVSTLTFDAYLYDNSEATTLSIYKAGNLVSSIMLGSASYTGLGLDQYLTVGSRNFYNGTGVSSGILKIDGNGTTFDEVRFAENAGGAAEAYFVIDNARFDRAAVPEPTSAALFALGLAGLTAFRRKFKKAV